MFGKNGDGTKDNTKTFCEGVQVAPDSMSEGRNWVVGNNYTAYKEYWENLEAYTEERCETSEVSYIDARDIEGIHLHDNEVSNEEGFWSRHISGRSKDTMFEITEHLPEVVSRLEQGESVESLREDKTLGPCVDTYCSEPIQVAKGDGFYVFLSDGRHRTIAAQSIKSKIPVKVVAIIRKRSR